MLDGFFFSPLVSVSSSGLWPLVFWPKWPMVLMTSKTSGSVVCLRWGFGNLCDLWGFECSICLWGSGTVGIGMASGVPDTMFPLVFQVSGLPSAGVVSGKTGVVKPGVVNQAMEPRASSEMTTLT